MSITDLNLVLESLGAGERRLFRQIFHLSIATGRLNPPPTMHSWIEHHFGSVKAVTSQRVVKVANLVAAEETLFNRLRASRPSQAEDNLDIAAQLIADVKDDPLHEPGLNTPQDIFGRVQGEHCITASNIAKYDAWHGMVIFNEHNPLLFSREQVIDYLDTGWEWAQKAHSADQEAKYYLFIWNCLWRAGASLAHGHAQVMLTRDRHYAKIEGLRRTALRYEAEYGSNYFQDLYRVHLSLGCALEKDGTKVLAYLTPLKDKEVLLMADEFSPSLKERIYEVLACFRDRLGVSSFNLALALPPLAEVEESWEGFPALARVVDRGDPKSRASDIGAMELYAASVVSSDPFEVAEALKEELWR